ncbi:MAG: hypothetical protein QM811_09575 [Pirellulales bacterium]
MLNPDLLESIQDVAKRLILASVKDADFRKALRLFCEDFLDATDQYEENDEDPRRGGNDRDDYDRQPQYDNDYRRPMRNERPAYGEQRNYNEPRNYGAPQRDFGNRYDAHGGNDRGGYDRGGNDRGDYRNDRGNFDRQGGYDRPGNERGRQWDRPQRSDEEELKLIEDRCKLKSKGGALGGRTSPNDQQRRGFSRGNRSEGSGNHRHGEADSGMLFMDESSERPVAGELELVRRLGLVLRRAG